jgi:hypothetical protein
MDENILNVEGRAGLGGKTGTATMPAFKQAKKATM